MFEKNFLNRIKFSRTSARQESEESGKVVSDQDDPGPTCPPSVSTRQMAQIRQQIKTLRKEQQTGGWRASARWLEENCEEFREAKAVPRSEQAPHPEGVSSGQESSSAELRAGVPTLQLQGPCIAPGCPQSSAKALPASPPIQALESAFWQGLLYGNPDALIPGSDATRALQLVSDKLGIRTVTSETLGTLRAGQLRKLLRQRFGPLQVEEALAALWRIAPASPSAPISNEDQSHCTPGVRECPRSTPAWRREFHREISPEQRLLESIGGWSGS